MRVNSENSWISFRNDTCRIILQAKFCLLWEWFNTAIKLSCLTAWILRRFRKKILKYEFIQQKILLFNSSYSILFNNLMCNSLSMTHHWKRGKLLILSLLFWRRHFIVWFFHSHLDLSGSSWRFKILDES